MNPMILWTLLGCAEQEGEKAPEPTPVDGIKVEAEAVADAALSWEAFGPVIMSVPDGDGPTEIRQGNKLVGVVFRAPKSNVEYIYMANGLVASMRQGNSDPAAEGIGPYPSYLSPHGAAFDTTLTGTGTQHEQLLECDDSGCQGLKEAGVDRWDSVGSFQAGIIGVLNERFGVSTLSATSFTKVQGDIGRWDKFDLTECQSRFVQTNQNYVHTDGATIKGRSGWQFVERTASGSKAVFVARLVDDPRDMGVKTHSDAQEPSVSAGTQIGDAWCQNLWQSLDGSGQPQNGPCYAAPSAAPACLMVYLDFKPRAWGED